jgi:hypothetical protein
MKSCVQLLCFRTLSIVRHSCCVVPCVWTLVCSSQQGWLRQSVSQSVSQSHEHSCCVVPCVWTLFCSSEQGWLLNILLAHSLYSPGYGMKVWGTGFDSRKRYRCLSLHILPSGPEARSAPQTDIPLINCARTSCTFSSTFLSTFQFLDGHATSCCNDCYIERLRNSGYLCNGRAQPSARYGLMSFLHVQCFLTRNKLYTCNW